jgi:serine/threonine protein phosphatase PrpC
MVRLPDSGRVLLCSDGLWNYFPNHERLNMLVSCGMNSPAALLQARTLVEFALSQGGRDNVTAAILTI